MRRHRRRCQRFESCGTLLQAMPCKIHVPWGERMKLHHAHVVARRFHQQSGESHDIQVKCWFAGLGLWQSAATTLKLRIKQ